MPRRWRRDFRKSIGLPATNDVGTLATLISGLRALAEQQLGHSINSAVLVTPKLVGIYKDDLDDALEYVGLVPAPFRYKEIKWDAPHKLSTSYAGYGLGLCESYTDYSRCKSEEQELPHEVVLAVLCTEHVLGISISPMEIAYKSLDWPQNYVHDFELGHSS